MQRARKPALIALLLGALAGVAYLVSRTAAREPPAPLAVALQEERVAAAVPAQIDTPPPPPRAAAGWPFAQLPYVAKFEAPVPRLSTTTVRHISRVEPVPPRQWPPPPAQPDGVSPLWLASPLAAGAYLVSADVTGSVVPEPGTLLLLGSGLLLLGFKVRQRRS